MQKPDLMISIPPSEINRIVRRSYIPLQTYVLLWTPLAAYLDGLCVGLAKEETSKALLGAQLPSLIILGLIGPYLVVRFAIRRALEDRPGARPGERLAVEGFGPFWPRQHYFVRG